MEGFPSGCPRSLSPSVFTRLSLSLRPNQFQEKAPACAYFLSRCLPARNRTAVRPCQGEGVDFLWTFPPPAPLSRLQVLQNLRDHSFLSLSLFPLPPSAAELPGWVFPAVFETAQREEFLNRNICGTWTGEQNFGWVWQLTLMSKRQKLRETRLSRVVVAICCPPPRMVRVKFCRKCGSCLRKSCSQRISQPLLHTLSQTEGRGEFITSRPRDPLWAVGGEVPP